MQLDSITTDTAIINIRNSLMNRLERAHFTAYRFYELLNTAIDNFQSIVDKLADLNGVPHKLAISLPDLELLVDTSTAHNLQDVAEILFSHNIVCNKYDDIHRQESAAYELIHTAFQELMKHLKDQEGRLNGTIKHALKAIKRLSSENKELCKNRESLSKSRSHEEPMNSFKLKYEESVSKTKEILDKNQELIKENSELRNQVLKYQKEMREIEGKYEEMVRQAMECKEQKDMNCIKLNHMHELYDELMKKYAAFEEMYDRAVKENAEMREEIEFKVHLDEEYTKEIEKYDNSLKDLKSDLQRAEQGCLKFKTYYEDFSERCLQLEEIECKLQQENDKLSSELIKYKDMFKELDERYHNLEFQSQLHQQEKENLQNTNQKLIEKLESMKSSLQSRNELRKQNKYMREKLEEYDYILKSKEDLQHELSRLYSKLDKNRSLKADKESLSQQNLQLKQKLQSLQYNQRLRREYRDLTQYVGLGGKNRSEGELAAYSNLIQENDELRLSERSLKDKVLKLETDINWLVEQLAENARQSRELEKIVEDQMRSSFMKQAVLLRKKEKLENIICN
jgi:chromosome segregation ATPase